MKTETIIARGRTADLCAWDEDWVLKLFKDWVSEEHARYEARITETVHQAGISSPAVGELLRVGERWGLLLEKVEGVSMLDQVLGTPWKTIHYARQLAELHLRMHAREIEDGLPEMKGRLKGKIRAAGELLPAKVIDILLADLEKLPGGKKICHGDFHPGNVIMGSTNVVAIDWIDAVKGNPIADAARTSIILRGILRDPTLSWRVRIQVRFFHQAYLSAYFHDKRGKRKEFDRWLPIIAAGRLSEGIKELEPWLMDRAGKGR